MLQMRRCHCLLSRIKLHFYSCIGIMFTEPSRFYRYLVFMKRNKTETVKVLPLWKEQKHSIRPTGLKICACLLLIVLKALCLCFLTQSSTAIDVGAREEAYVSYTRNSGSSQDAHGATLAGSQNDGADNSTNAVDVIAPCNNSHPDYLRKYFNMGYFYNELCPDRPIELIQGKHTGFKWVNTIVMRSEVRRYFRLASVQ